MSVITRENFTEALEAVVAERGEDFVYPNEWREEPAWVDTPGRCKYTRTDENGKRVGACIVGAALERILGEPYEGVNESASEILYTRFGVRDEVFLAAVGEAQHMQDSGRPWGHALATYRENL